MLASRALDTPKESGRHRAHWETDPSIPCLIPARRSGKQATGIRGVCSTKHGPRPADGVGVGVGVRVRVRACVTADTGAGTTATPQQLVDKVTQRQARI